MDLGTALIGLFTAIVVKMAVMIFVIRLLLRFYGVTLGEMHSHRLWNLLPEDAYPEIKLLWWSLFAFFLSEFFCGIEVYIMLRSTVFFSSLHAVMSSVGMGLFSMGMYLFFNRTVVRYGEKGCILNRVCKECPVIQGQSCNYKMMSLLMGTFLLLSAIPPLLSPTNPLTADPLRYILPFESMNQWYDQTLIPMIRHWYPAYQPASVTFVFPHAVQVLEFKILPIISAILSTLGILFLRKEQLERGALTLLFSFGILAYSYFELALYRMTQDLIMGSLIHELAEFWFLLIVAEFLRKSFQKKLGVIDHSAHAH